MNKQKAVVLVHGLWMNQWVMKYLGWHFKKQKFEVYYFDYPSMRHKLQQNVDSFADFILNIKADSLCLVGHSLGGILCVEYLKQYNPANVHRCLLLGSPVNGSQVARAMRENRFGRFLLGNSGEALVAGYAAKLDNKFAMILGTGGKGLGQLFGPLSLPHDGAVALQDAMPDRQIKHIVLPVSHSSMLFSKTVAMAALHFCSRGEFPDEFKSLY